MQKCKKCSNQLKNTDIIKSIWIRSYGPILCDGCKTKNHVTVLTRLITALSIGIPPLIFNILMPFNIIKINFSNPFLIIISVYLIWIILMICITPVFARYDLKDNEE